MNSVKKHNVVFMGTPLFAIPSLKALINSELFNVSTVITQPDRPVGRNRVLQASPIKQLAIEQKIPVLTPDKVKHNSELLEQLKQISPDVIVVAAYGKILPLEILDLPKLGIVNLHASLLPKLRGASPIAGSILAGDNFTGITLMKMAEAMDTGPIIATSQKVAIDPLDTTGSLSTKLAEIGANLLIESLPKYLAGTITPQPQDETQATYTKIIHKIDGLINWQTSAEEIVRKIRAYSPWPGSFTNFNGKLIKILQAEILTENPVAPGNVWQTSDKYPAIATPTGSLKIIKLQLEGKSATSGKDFLLGYPTFVGSILS